MGPTVLESTAIASQRTGDPTAGDERLAAWADGELGATRWQLTRLVADDGKVEDLGGGCGEGGTALATCAITGHASFVHWLHGAVPSAPSFLVVATRQAGVPCGPCTFVPDPASGVTVPVATDALGSAAVPMPIPALASLKGVELLDQWLTIGASPCFVALAFSNAIEIEIE